jgi:hypothetical protein
MLPPLLPLLLLLLLLLLIIISYCVAHCVIALVCVDGLISEGEKDVVMLTRSAWAGMQRWGAALWSGDTSSHWPSLKVSIQAGLNTQLSGISWWTTGAFVV